MAGHSKWANIQHRKNAQDARRGKLFTRLIREITVAARTGGADAASNPRLRIAVDKALSSNMTKDTVERAIKRGAGGQDNDQIEEIRYEGYGPGGVAVLVDCVTDNRNRTVSEVRHAFTKYGGNLGTAGSVGFLFRHQGVLYYAPGTDEERLMAAALEAGAEDVVNHDDGSFEVLTAPYELAAVQDAMRAAGLAPAEAETLQRAGTPVAVAGEDAERLTRLLGVLEDLEDVQNVYTNADLPAEIADAD